MFFHHIQLLWGYTVCYEANISFLGTPFMEWIFVYAPPTSLSGPGLILPFSKEVLFFINSSMARRRCLLIIEIQFPMLFLCLFRVNQKWKAVILYHIPSASRSHGYFLYNSSMSSSVFFNLSSPHWSSLP